MVSTQDAQERSFPLPGFEHRLWEELVALHAEQSEHAGEGEVRPRGRRRPGGVVPRLVAAGVVAVMAVGVGWLAASDDERRGADAEAGVRTEAPSEVAPGEDAVVVATSDGTTVWRDEATGAWRQVSADAIVEIVVAVGDDAGAIVIDHDRREYSILSGARLADRSGSIADHFRERMATEGWVYEATEEIDGRTVERHVAPTGDARLCGIEGDPRGYSADQCGQPGVEEVVIGGLRQEVWIDPVTGRPVRELRDAPGDQYVDLDVTYEFLPRTPENLALLGGELPDGYRQVDQLLVAYSIP